VAPVKIEDSIATDHLAPPDEEKPKGGSPEDEVIVADITSSRDLWQKIKKKQLMRIPEDHPHEPQELTLASHSNAKSSNNGTDANGNPLTLLYREQQDPRFVWGRRYSQGRKRPGRGARRRAEDRRQHDLVMDQQRLHRRILKQRKAYLAGVGNWWDVPTLNSLP